MWAAALRHFLREDKKCDIDSLGPRWEGKVNQYLPIVWTAILGETMLSRIVSLLVVFVCSIGSISAAYSEEKDDVSRVVFLPFDISAAGKYAPLEAAFQNMLVSRLAVKDRVEVVDYSLDTKEVSRLKRSFKKGDSVPLFQQLNADYLVSGALFALDRGLQMQVVL